VTAYLLAIGLVFAANVVPAFAPPTWSLLVYLELSYDMRPAVLVVIGVVAAAAGRTVLAYGARRSTRWMPVAYVRNMETVGRALTRSKGRTLATLGLFLLSPLSSAQLFAAAGIMKTVRLRPLVLAFALGRAVTYSSYVTGAHLVKNSTFGDVVLEALRSPWAIAVQVLMLAAVVALGMHRWTDGASSGTSAKE